MDSNAGSDIGDDGQVVDLVDVTAMALADLVSSDDTVLTNALRRLLAELDRPQEQYAAFGQVPR